VLCFDGDDAGDRAINRFRQNVRGKLIEEVVIPRNKDVNDLTLEQFKNLERRGI
jgi:DNA primase